ncbi:hypothetical protein [Gemmatimonas groenlandica]|uniref:Uncharacterized protein n=1 Tax=Gemmatimonas groenlandica TaxID=2732249 RepID=A0A6M4IVA7_9BACT|nr:hypothetical protein [Gemmatimonas groenlandica]QJR36121.1 hypothetical protein HKW67_11700 [Gemmatimonas groenlandica]
MNTVRQQPASPGLPAEIAQTIRETQQATRDAAQATRDAAQATRDAAQADADAARAPAEPLPPGTIVFTGDGSGENVRINVKGGNVVLSQGDNTTTIPLRDVVPQGLVQMSWALAASVIAVFIGWPIARAIARAIDRRGRAVRADNALEAQLQQRFDAMERNIDTVAVEMERLSEAQRFTSKLLEQRSAAEQRAAVPVDANR